MLIGHQLRKHKSSKTNHNPQFSFTDYENPDVYRIFSFVFTL